jgi:hypothetical protein
MLRPKQHKTLLLVQSMVMVDKVAYQLEEVVYEQVKQDVQELHHLPFLVVEHVLRPVGGAVDSRRGKKIRVSAE